MADELDLDRMQQRRDSYMTPQRLVHATFLHHAADDMGMLIEECRRLRALVAPLETVWGAVQVWAYVYKTDNYGALSDSEDTVMQTYLDACRALERKP